jgi:hypothetical protein
VILTVKFDRLSSRRPAFFDRLCSRQLYWLQRPITQPATAPIFVPSNMTHEPADYRNLYRPLL